MDTQYTFTVKTNDICVICLDENSGNGLNEVSLKRLSQFLDLDYKKIFNIQKSLFPGETSLTDEDERECVDIMVSLCKGCNKMRNKFYELYKQYEWIIHRMEMCVQNIHEVMVTGEKDAERVRKFQDEMTATGNIAIENSIPQRFRRETMSQCVKHAQYSGNNMQVENKVEQQPHSMENREDLPSSSKSTSDVSGGSSSKRMRMTVNEPLVSVVTLPNNGEVEVDDDFEGDDDVDDEEKDPEELMREFDAYVSSNNEDENYLLDAEDMIHATAQFHELAGTSFQCSEPSPENEVELFEFENDVDDATNEQYNYIMTTQPEGTEGTERPPFSSKYKCDICGKIVVSLKNFELHQRRHKGEKPFECEVCKKTFRDTSNLRSHALRYHRHLLFAKFKNPDLSVEEFSAALECLVMSVRVKIPKEEIVVIGDAPIHNPHGCRLCGKQYTQGYVIEDHVVQRHYTILAKAVVSLQTRINRLSREDLFQHLNSLQEQGANEESSSCGMCGEEFPTGEEVNLHIRSHIKIKVARNKCDVERRKVTSFTPSGGAMIRMKMKCEPCGRYFDDLEALEKHKQQYRNGACTRIQNKSSIFACEFCGRNFNSYYNQRAHIVSFHRFEVFSKYLPQGTESHIIETGIRALLQNFKRLPIGTFECGWCHKEITQLRKLNSHVLVTHFDDICAGLRQRIARKSV